MLAEEEGFLVLVVRRVETAEGGSEGAQSRASVPQRS